MNKEVVYPFITRNNICNHPDKIKPFTVLTFRHLNCPAIYSKP
jgi:hypothetical protein